MGIRKDWIDEQISSYKTKAIEEPDSLKKQYFDGVVMGLEIARKELTKPPRTKEEIKNEKKNKIFDPDKIFEDVVAYYMNNDKFINANPDIEVRKKKANDIAMSVVQGQQQKRMNHYEN